MRQSRGNGMPGAGHSHGAIFSAALDLEDFIGIEEQQDLRMIMALEEIRKGTCEGGCGQDTRRSSRSGSSQGLELSEW